MPGPSQTPTPTRRDPYPLELAAAVLRGRWSAIVVLHLLEEPRRFFQLMRDIEGVSRQALAHCLAELERRGVVRRGLHEGEASRLEYELTQSGRALRAVIEAMDTWGIERCPGSAKPSRRSPAARDTGRQEP